MKRRSPLLTPRLLAAASLAACSPSQFHAPAVAAAPEASPLGPSYVLLPLPTDEETLLGRVLPELPEAGRSLEEVSRPNPCIDGLAEAKTSPLASSFEDAREVSGSAKARAMLGVFGFEGDASRASHFVYRLEAQKRVARTDTNAYVKCCEEKGGCGVGFVSALVYGEGEYATGEETNAAGAVSVPMAGAGGSVQMKVLHRRKVHGYLAALVTLTSKEQAGGLGVFGVGSFEPSVPARVQLQYEKEKVSILELPEGNWALVTGEGPLTENEFARRYEQRTGSEELRPVERRRNTGALVTVSAITALSAYGTYWGATNLKKACTSDGIECTHHSNSGATLPAGMQCVSTATDGTCSSYIDPTEKRTNVTGIVTLSLTAPVTLIGLFSVVALASDGDGTPTSHVLSQDDARRYATRYNRAILRGAKEKVRHEVQIEQQAGLRLWPVAGPGGLGLAGTW